MKNTFVTALGILAALIVAVMLMFTWINEMWGAMGVAIVGVGLAVLVFTFLILGGGFMFAFGIARLFGYTLGTSIANAGRQGNADASYYRYMAQVERNKMLTDRAQPVAPVFSGPSQGERQWASEGGEDSWGNTVDADGWTIG